MGLIWFLFSAEAISDEGYIYEILENSKRFASDIATQLRERIYESVIPYLATGIIKARKLDKPKENDVKLIYEMALKIVQTEKKASTSFLQRKLQIGYNRAARIIEEMEEKGIVTKANHVGKREVL